MHKRQAPHDDSASPPQLPRPTKKRRAVPSAPRQSGARRQGVDRLSPLSDELLLRVLSFLTLQQLIAVAPVSRRLYHLTADSQIWKALYYSRFVLPRAMRIPGFRNEYGAGSLASGGGHKLHYKGRRTLWADGRRGGIIRDSSAERPRRNPGPWNEGEQWADPVDWKRQYKIRHNWAIGKCAVEELKLGDTDLEIDEENEGKMLAKVVEGIAITADEKAGMRAWNLRTRELLAQISLRTVDGAATPTCMALDDRLLDGSVLDVAIGFADGGFGVWRFNAEAKQLRQRYRHERSSNGQLIAVALSYPYLLTTTESVLLSLYTFGMSRKQAEPDLAPEARAEPDSGPEARNGGEGERSHVQQAEENQGNSQDAQLRAPYLLTSLKSHTSRPPLALSIRKTATARIASIAYVFSTRQGWSIGIQELHIREPSHGSDSAPEVTSTRLAYSPSDNTASAVSSSLLSPPATPMRRQRQWALSPSSSPLGSPPTPPEPGPTTLCYTHPYLLVTLPDNTLILYLCTSNARTLSITPGIRLWGHTSGISDAEITARGKAVSVSSRGEEMRVWELEGRSAGVGGGRSVEISSRTSSAAHAVDWDERRNWVGFDDEMVIVLKEKKGGTESLLVYDFT